MSDAAAVPLPSMGSLVVGFLDEEFEVLDGESFTFGRDARLVVDAANPHLHRVLGTFIQHGDLWTLCNVGRHLPMVVSDGFSRTELNSGGVLSLLSTEFTVTFGAGAARYAISGTLAETGRPARVNPLVTDTMEIAVPSLNDDQRLLVAALAEPLLSDDAHWPASMPSNREVADRLGWSATKLNRKLDYLCGRIAEHGVDGVSGDSGRRATVRRIRLVEFLVGTRTITLADVGSLPPVRRGRERNTNVGL